MNLIDRIKYFYFYNRFKSILDKNNIDYFETKNFAIENTYKDCISVMFKDIEYYFCPDRFTITTEHGTINSYFVPFDNIFWEMLKEFKSKLKEVRAEIKTKQCKIFKELKKEEQDAFKNI